MGLQLTWGFTVLQFRVLHTVCCELELSRSKWLLNFEYLLLFYCIIIPYGQRHSLRGRGAEIYGILNIRRRSVSTNSDSTGDLE